MASAGRILAGEKLILLLCRLGIEHETQILQVDDRRHGAALLSQHQPAAAFCNGRQGRRVNFQRGHAAGSDPG